jgi:hypothetical protein
VGNGRYGTYKRYIFLGNGRFTSETAVKRLLRELGSGKVGYNKYELVNVIRYGKEDG